MTDTTTYPIGMPREPQEKRRRGGVIAVVATVVVVVLIAGGGFAAWRFLAGDGPRPAEVLPTSTFAVVSVDLDPAGGQKLEAIRTLRKIPSFREHSGITADSDLVKELFDASIGRDCKNLSYATDVKPWIGLRAAAAGVELADKKPVLAVVVQVKDRDAAQKGFTQIQQCAEKQKSPFGFAVGQDYVVVTDTTAHAGEILAAGVKTPLSQSPEYQKWTESAGGAGVVNAYAAPQLPQVAGDLIAQELGAGVFGGTAKSGKGKATGPGAELTQALKGFRGAAAVLRFHDSGLELSFAGGTASPVSAGPSVGDHVAALPKDTVVVLAGATNAQSLNRLKSQLGGGAAAGLGADPGRIVEQLTGLRFPQDVATLLGTSFSVSLGGDAPRDLTRIKDPRDLPFGVLVHGNAPRIKGLVARVEARTGQRLSSIPATLKSTNGKVALASSPSYAADLLRSGSLGDEDSFKNAVPHAADSPFVVYASLSDSWSTAIADAVRRQGGKDGAEIAADVKALDALGLSTWTKDGDSHGLLRVTLK